MTILFDQLHKLTPLTSWHLRHTKAGGQVFPTFGSLQWFIRTHRALLIERGCLIPGKGGRRSLLTADFENVVFMVLLDEAREELRCIDPHNLNQI
ncbi:MAG: hypothetical protein P8N61_00810 [Porticoccaceae bacterium]|nr:hypothetical protein [Porticoccaceae bacterium]